MAPEPFRVSEQAIGDIDAIWLYLLEREGVETADKIVTKFFRAFDLSRIPNKGQI